MSLLNDMLRDLAQQPSLAPPSAPETQIPLGELALMKRPRPGWRLPLVVFVLVLALALFARQLWSGAGSQIPGAGHQQLAEQEHLAAQELGPPMDASNIAAPRGDSVALSGIADLAGVAEPHNSPVSNQEIEQQQEITRLLTLAEKARARDRLTSPIDDNAYSYYQQVLALESEQPQARQGLLQVAERYKAMAQTSQQRGETKRALNLLARARVVMPEDTQLAALQTEWQSALQSPMTEPVTSPEPASIALAPESLPAGESYIAPNPEWQDQQQAAQAQRLVSEGKTPQALQQLEQFVTVNPQAYVSTKLLLELYCRAGNTAAAADLLQSANRLDELDRVYFRARLALLRQDESQALILLEGQSKAAKEREDYRSLLAGLYQKTAAYPQAAAAYRGLLQDFGEKPAYWLGYALALDALAQKLAARQAYERLAQFPHLQAEVRTYIAQRIAALGS